MTAWTPASAGMPSRLGCLFLAIVSGRGLVAATAAAEVWVITDGRHPVSARAGVRIIELDAPSRIQAELAAQLPTDPQRAAAIVRTRLNERDTLHQLLASAYQGVTDAWSLGITKIPAVIVDRRYVIYGEPDVNRAVSLIETYRSSKS